MGPRGRTRRRSTPGWPWVPGRRRASSRPWRRRLPGRALHGRRAQPAADPRGGAVAAHRRGAPSSCTAGARVPRRLRSPRAGLRRRDRQSVRGSRTSAARRSRSPEALPPPPPAGTRRSTVTATLHGLFMHRAASLLRAGRAARPGHPHVGVRISMDHGPTRRAHDALCARGLRPARASAAAPSTGVFQPCMGLLSTRLAPACPAGGRVASWPLARSDLDVVSRRLLGGSPRCPAAARALFGERGLPDDAAEDAEAASGARTPRSRRTPAPSGRAPTWVKPSRARRATTSIAPA